MFGQPSLEEDRCQSAGRTLADLILLRPGKGKRDLIGGADACDGSDARDGVGACY